MRGVRSVLKPGSLAHPRCPGTTTLAFSSATGRGRGIPFGPIGKFPEEKQDEDSSWKTSPKTLPGAGRGHGITPPPPGPSPSSNPQRGPGSGPGLGFNPFAAWGDDSRGSAIPPAGRGRGRTDTDLQQHQQQEDNTLPKFSLQPPRPPGPVFIKRSPESSAPRDGEVVTPVQPGAYGRGQGVAPGDSTVGGRQQKDGGSEMLQRSPQGQTLVNRHSQPSTRGGAVMRGRGRGGGRASLGRSTVQKLTGEEAVKQAIEILEKRLTEAGESVEYEPVVAARGRGRGRDARGGRGRGRGDIDPNAIMEDVPGTDADADELKKYLGEDRWIKLTEMLEERIANWLPSPEDEAIEKELDLALKIDFEPEFGMENFETNPEIDESKSPISLREYLKKLKPQLCANEGITSEEEWETFMEDMMERAPYLRILVKKYAGKPKYTAFKENRMLDNAAHRLSPEAPDYAKEFMERCLITLKKNPGWQVKEKERLLNKLATTLNNHSKGKILE